MDNKDFSTAIEDFELTLPVPDTIKLVSYMMPNNVFQGYVVDENEWFKRLNIQYVGLTNLWNLLNSHKMYQYDTKGIPRLIEIVPYELNYQKGKTQFLSLKIRVGDILTGHEFKIRIHIDNNQRIVVEGSNQKFKLKSKVASCIDPTGWNYYKDANEMIRTLYGVLKQYLAEWNIELDRYDVWYLERIDAEIDLVFQNLEKQNDFLKLANNFDPNGYVRNNVEGLNGINYFSKSKSRPDIKSYNKSLELLIKAGHKTDKHIIRIEESYRKQCIQRQPLLKSIKFHADSSKFNDSWNLNYALNVLFPKYNIFLPLLKAHQKSEPKIDFSQLNQLTYDIIRAIANEGCKFTTEVCDALKMNRDIHSYDYKCLTKAIKQLQNQGFLIRNHQKLTLLPDGTDWFSKISECVNFPNRRQIA